MCVIHRHSLALRIIKAGAFPYHADIQLVLLPRIGDCVLQPTDIQLAVYMGNSLLNQLCRVKIYRIGVFVVDGFPQLLELFSLETVIQRVSSTFGLLPSSNMAFSRLSS